VAALLAGVLGLPVGHLANRLAGSFPWRGEHAVRTAAPLPAVELATAALLALVVLRCGVSAALPAWLFFAAAGVLLAVVDLREKLLPNRVLLPVTGVVLALLTVAAAAAGDWSALLRAVLAGSVSFAVGLAMAVLAPSGLGMGDVKLAGLLGLVLGWSSWSAVLLGFLVGFVLQAVLGLALLAARRAGRRTQLPFGPALLAGALAVLLLTGGTTLPGVA
jgi:leader peptidase (prepilin peptidase) / N-methyltransferase